MTKRQFMIVSLGAFVLGCCVFLLLIRFSRQTTPASSPSIADPQLAPTPPPPSGSGRHASSAANRQSPIANRQSSIVNSSSPIANRQSPVVSPPLPVPDVEFTVDDIMENRSISKVWMDIGGYEVVAGDEFAVNVHVTAPALANFSLMLTFDPEYLEYVAESAKAVGGILRSGMEFYAQNDAGRMILLSSGNPGSKHTDRIEGGVIATLHMRAKKAGETRLRAVSDGIILLNALGSKLDYELAGGKVRITEATSP